MPVIVEIEPDIEDKYPVGHFAGRAEKKERPVDQSTAETVDELVRVGPFAPRAKSHSTFRPGQG